MPKFDKIKHSEESFRRTAPKQGRGGKGTWGNKMDDIKFMEEPPAAALDKNDPNYEEPVDDAFEEDLWHAEGMEHYFDDMAEQKSQPQKTRYEVVSDLKVRVKDLLEQFLSTDMTMLTFVNTLQQSMPEDFSCNATVARSFCSPVLAEGGISDQKREEIASLLDAVFKEKLLNRQDIDDAISSLLTNLLSGEQVKSLLAFANALVARGVLGEERVQVLQQLATVNDVEAHRQILKKKINGIITEYFSNTDLGDCIQNIKELNTNFYEYEIVKIVVSMAMDRDSKCRELASELLGCENVFSRPALRQGFQILLERLDDLKNDVPDACEILACFIARAISDEAIPPSFVDSMSYHQGLGRLSISCLQKITHLLHMKMSAQRLSRVWGPGRGRPVSELKVSIKNILKEFFNHNDMNELALELTELDEKNFHHEFVKQSIIEASDSNKAELVGNMLLAFVKKEIIDTYQLRLAYRRVEKNLNNYKIDSPTLPKVFDHVKSIVVLPTANQEPTSV